MDLDNGMKLKPILQGCVRGERSSQKDLYTVLYRYGMSICLKFSKNEEEAKEIAHDAFMKIYTKLGMYRYEQSFKSWVRRIFINSAIDYYRKNHKYHNVIDISEIPIEAVQASAPEILAHQDILQMVQKLPPSYRLVFTLFVVEGYKHQEIADKLGIGVGTSKSNLAKARMKLRTMLNAENNHYHEKYG